VVARKFSKKVTKGLFTLKNGQNIGATGAIRTLFAPANKDDVDNCGATVRRQVERDAALVGALEFYWG
jgi:hypothetical protein